MDVDKGSNSQYWAARLSMVDKVSLAGLVFRVPLEDIELRVISSVGRRLCMPGMSGIGGKVELFMGITVCRTGVSHLTRLRCTQCSRVVSTADVHWHPHEISPTFLAELIVRTPRQTVIVLHRKCNGR